MHREYRDFLDSIVTGDEMWCHYVTPKTKQQSRQWRHTGLAPYHRLAADSFVTGFGKWISRQQKCVEKSGDYVEKQLRH